MVASKVRKKKRKENITQIKQQIPKHPVGLFDIIVVDPPWPYGTNYDDKGRRAASPYPEQSLEEIKQMKIPATDNCILWLWTTHKFMRYSFDILDYWGFRDVAILTWVKNKMGLGQWLPNFILKSWRCTESWQPRKVNPKRCPGCKSPYWNIERKVKNGK